MRRRELLVILGGGAGLAARVALGAEQGKLPLVGYFSGRSAEAEAPVRGPFATALEQIGFAVGRDVEVDYLFADGRSERLPAIAAEFVHRSAAVLVATDPRAALAAKAATATTPIVFTSGPDPVRLGLVASLHRPGGNATGVSLFTSQLGPKRLGLLREILPKPGLIAFVVDPKNESSAFQIEELEAAARDLAQPLMVLKIGNAADIDAAFATMAERRVAGLLYGASTFFQVIAEPLIAAARKHAMPALYEWREFVAAGGLMSYSTSRTEVGRQLGDYVGKILKGARPANLPVVQSARFELVLNLNTAKALGLAVPQSLLARADEVIE